MASRWPQRAQRAEERGSQQDGEAATESGAEAAPATAEYSKSAGAGGVMQLLTKIIADSESEGQMLVLEEKDRKSVV